MFKCIYWLLGNASLKKSTEKYAHACSVYWIAKFNPCGVWWNPNLHHFLFHFYKGTNGTLWSRQGGGVCINYRVVWALHHSDSQAPPTVPHKGSSESLNGVKRINDSHRALTPFKSYYTIHLTECARLQISSVCLRLNPTLVFTRSWVIMLYHLSVRKHSPRSWVIHTKSP